MPEESAEWKSYERVDHPWDIETEDWTAGAHFWIDEDPYDDEHVAFLLHHPGFQKDIAVLREDYEMAGYDAPKAIKAARDNPDDVPYPARGIAEKWGLAPVDVASFAATAGDHKVLARERSTIRVQEKPTEYVLRVPRPVTPVRRKALQAWLQEESKRRGEFEERSLGRKQKPGLSPALQDALPWFDRWQAGESPAAIWRSLGGPGSAHSFDVVAQAITRVWERLREISPDGVRPDRPSKGPG